DVASVDEGVNVAPVAEGLEQFVARIGDTGRLRRKRRDEGEAPPPDRAPWRANMLVGLGRPGSDIAPGRSLVAAKPSPERLVGEGAFERRPDRAGVSWVELRVLRDELDEGRRSGRKRRCAARERLGDRKAEPLVERREDEQLARLVEDNELRVADVPGKEHATGDAELLELSVEPHARLRQHQRD